MKTRLASAFLALALAAAALLCVPSRASAQGVDYAIGAQDVLSVTVFGETDLTGKFTVQADGSFTFPLIGSVKAGGLTLRAVEQELQRRLADGYLRNPQVTVAIETFRSQRILVVGEVRAAAEYQLNGEMSLLSAIVHAGGLTATAGREIAVVRQPRAREGTTMGDPDIIKVDIDELMSGKANLQLQDGDTVNVPKALSAFVFGQVKSPGGYAVDRTTTVQQLLALAGGLTDRGREGGIKIRRTVDRKVKDLPAKLTDIVQPGDTIIVPEKFF
jgi:polysaccharide export outer membrane protein